MLDVGVPDLDCRDIDGARIRVERVALKVERGQVRQIDQDLDVADLIIVKAKPVYWFMTVAFRMNLWKSVRVCSSLEEG
jgi:hypothetical protein